MPRFRPGLRMTILVALLLPLIVGLGFWQIDRAAQKRAIENARLASFGALPIDESELAHAPTFARVRLEGRYERDRQFLLDNYTRHGRTGYVVVTPFYTVGGKRVLVDRGWILAPPLRSELPDAPPPPGKVSIVCMLWSVSAAIADTSVWDDGWPKRVEHFDGARMADAIGGAMPEEFRLEEGQPGSLKPIVVGQEMTSTQHIGYAVQWFAMAIALVVAFVAWGVRGGREE